MISHVIRKLNICVFLGVLPVNGGLVKSSQEWEP